MDEQNINIVLDELKKMDGIKYHRGKSWEHCYLFFRKHKKFDDNSELLDCAALYLGFFLASWGMLRGSSFLLQQDYKFFIPVIRILIQPKYDRLWNIDWSRADEKEENIDILFHLKDCLKKKIKENTVPQKEPTDLLVTKIIMATMGCVPAYDTFFKEGLKALKIENCQNFSKSSFKNLLDLKSFDEFDKIKRLIDGTSIEYPSMKLLDLYFWLRGSQTKTQK